MVFHLLDSIHEKVFLIPCIFNRNLLWVIRWTMYSTKVAIRLAMAWFSDRMSSWLTDRFDGDTTGDGKAGSINGICVDWAVRRVVRYPATERLAGWQVWRWHNWRWQSWFDPKSAGWEVWRKMRWKECGWTNFGGGVGESGFGFRAPFASELLRPSWTRRWHFGFPHSW